MSETVEFGYKLAGIDLWITAEVTVSGSYSPATRTNPEEYPDYECDELIICTDMGIPDFEDIELDISDISYAGEDLEYILAEMACTQLAENPPEPDYG